MRRKTKMTKMKMTKMMRMKRKKTGRKMTERKIVIGNEEPKPYVGLYDSWWTLLRLRSTLTRM